MITKYIVAALLICLTTTVSAQDTLHIRFREHSTGLTKKDKKKILEFINIPTADCNTQLQIACYNPGCFSNKGGLAWDQSFAVSDFILAAQVLEKSQVYFVGFISSLPNTVTIWFAKNNFSAISPDETGFF